MSTTLTPTTFRVTISEEQIVKNKTIQNARGITSIKYICYKLKCYLK
jgi:hypothetical protein